MANRFFPNVGRIFATHGAPCFVDAIFTVNAADTGGLGITGLKGAGVANVFMHTSQTPGVGNNGITNPNPASGTILIQLSDNYNALLGLDWRVLQSTTSGSALKVDNSALTAGVAYQITTLGDYTNAQWHTLGVPSGVTPAAGVSFIATSAGTAGNTSTSRVMLSATVSTLAQIEIFGNSNLAIASSAIASQGYGAQIICQCYDYAAAKVAPVDATVLAVRLYLANSSFYVGSNSAV